jgi:SAM-dependent methyltransferase
MLTIRFDRLGVRRGDLVLDAGAGFGRHAFELARQGANVIALDYADGEVVATRNTFGAMAEAGEIDHARYVGVLRGDATHLPFADGTFDRVITSEVLEHIQADTDAIAELHRVLRPGGTFAATVPTWFPEKINWMLSDEYHAPKSAGGHVRIYSATELKAKLRSAGLAVTGSHHAHALHSPYWWLKCAVGPRRDDNRAVNAYRRLLEWEIVEQPRGMRLAERALSPLLGKSFVVYATKPVTQPVDITTAATAGTTPTLPAPGHARSRSASGAAAS